jgi:hypothetical protein
MKNRNRGLQGVIEYEALTESLTSTYFSTNLKLVH